LIVFVARDSATKKAYKVPEMRVSKYDDLIVSKKCFELGLTIKDWSRDKSLRDMHERIPDFRESSNYQDFLNKMQTKLRTDPSKVVRM